MSRNEQAGSDEAPGGLRGWYARFSKSWIGSFVLVFAILAPLRSAVADWNDVPSASMEPTILIGDRIVVNKLAYGLRLPFTQHWLARWDDPAPGEIVVLFAPDTGDRLVKRLVAVPGDTLELKSNRLFINGVPLDYRPFSTEEVTALREQLRQGKVFAFEHLGTHTHAVSTTPAIRAMRDFGPVTLAADQFFVMGDNRDFSRDSRYFGTVTRDTIVGRVPAVALSVDKANMYMPRTERFFKGIE